MADTKISALPAAAAAAGANELAINEAGTSKKVTLTQMLALAWPVGSVFIAVVATNPATLLGFGTWAAFGAGRTLVGLDAADVDFDVVEETGGAKTVTLTTTEIPAHTHMQRRHGTTTGTLSGLTTAPDASSSGPADRGPVTGSTGGGGAHANLPPYIVVYLWKRTA